MDDCEEVVIVEVMELSLINDSLSNVDSISGSETIRRHYQSLIRKYETLNEDYQSLRKRYTDLVGFHSDYVSKIELAQEENFRSVCPTLLFLFI